MRGIKCSMPSLDEILKFCTIFHKPECCEVSREKVKVFTKTNNAAVKNIMIFVYHRIKKNEVPISNHTLLIVFDLKHFI